MQVNGTQKQSDSKHLIAYCLRQIWSQAGWLYVAVIFLGLLRGIVPLIQIVATSHIINLLAEHIRSGHGTRPGSTLAIIFPFAPWLCLMIGALAVNSTINSFLPYVSTLLGERVNERLQGAYYAKVLSLRLEHFEDASVHDTMQRAQSGLGSIVGFWIDFLPKVLSAVLSVAGILTLLSKASIFVPLILLTGAALTVKGNLAIGEIVRDINHRQMPHRRRLNYWRSLLTDRSMLPEVRLFRLEPYFAERWSLQCRELLDELVLARLKSLVIIGRVLISSHAVAAVSVAMLLYSLTHKDINLGAFVALVYAIRHYDDFVGNFIDWVQQYKETWASMLCVPKFFDIDGENVTSGSNAIIPFRDCIRFENVSFTYPGRSTPALKNLTLRIAHGERIAIVGENGSGKTTLAKLVLGLYQPTSGRITVDGVDLRDIEQRSWRATTGAVLQDFNKYSFSVRENIGIGCLDKMSASDIETAAKMSNADEFISSLPSGYDTVLGKEFEAGEELSYGQWQKLAIARAYIRDASIVVLDEPASALDAWTEHSIYTHFGELGEGRTMLLISHRLGSARLADRVLVMASGQILQDGTHEQLLQQEGPYGEMFRMQAEWYNDRETETAR